MAVNTIIHTIDRDQLLCIVSVYDDEEPILEYINIGISKNGTTDEVIENLKNIVSIYRDEKNKLINNPEIE